MRDEDLAIIFKALGDPTRLRIYTFLAECAGPVAVDDTGQVRPVEGPTVGEICCHVLGTPQSSPNISFHLKELRNAGLIVAEKRGKNVLYTVASDAQRQLYDYIDSVRKQCSCCK